MVYDFMQVVQAAGCKQILLKFQYQISFKGERWRQKYMDTSLR